MTDLKKTDYNAVLIVTHGSVLQAIYGISMVLDIDQASYFEIKQGKFLIVDI